MATATGPTDHTNSGDAYERCIGRWSRLVAREFVPWLAVPPAGKWLDVGCRTGAVSSAILDSAAPRSLLGIDSSAEFIAYAAARIGDARAQFKAGDAQALPVGDMGFDAVVSGLALNFVANKPRMVTEMRRAARRGAWIAIYVWDYAGEMQMLRQFWNAAVALEPVAKAFDDGVRYVYCKPAPLLAAFKEAGFADIECRVIDVPTVFKDFDDYWASIADGHGAATTYCAALDGRARAALRERLHAALPRGTDGSIGLIARAFALRGRRV